MEGPPHSDRRHALGSHANGASWRDLPEEEFGPWQTIYGRYNRWRKEGLWQQIAELLRYQR
jgi:transposase